MITYLFKAYVTVSDESALLAAATANAMREGATLGEAAERLAPGGEVDVSACLQQILDPGESPNGCEIEATECDGVYSSGLDDSNESDETYATDDGRHVRHDMGGYYLCTTAEGEAEDSGAASVGFDGREHFETIKEALAAGNDGKA